MLCVSSNSKNLLRAKTELPSEVRDGDNDAKFVGFRVLVIGGRYSASLFFCKNESQLDTFALLVLGSLPMDKFKSRDRKCVTLAKLPPNT